MAERDGLDDRLNVPVVNINETCHVFVHAMCNWHSIWNVFGCDAFENSISIQHSAKLTISFRVNAAAVHTKPLYYYYTIQLQSHYALYAYYYIFIVNNAIEMELERNSGIRSKYQALLLILYLDYHYCYSFSDGSRSALR